MQHRARKRFGQNFLQDPLIIQALIHAINPQKNDPMLEIGPGTGALTRPLLTKLDHLIAVEIDTDLQQALQQWPEYPTRLELVGADALSIDFSQWSTPLRIVGNLPYNISTPLLFHVLAQKQHVLDMHFMLQKEVVERLTAAPGSKAYGRLSIMVQVQCAVECLFLVPASAFKPAPKVESAVVRLTPRRHDPAPAFDEASLHQVVARAFTMRRKTLANNLKSCVSAHDLQALDINPGLRPEQISIAEYVRIAQFIFDSGKMK